MSIYSGFATRHQQQNYDENIATLLYLLQKRLHKFYLGQPANEQKFIELFLRIWSNVRMMEESKYLEPKFGSVLGELGEYLRGKKIGLEGGRVGVGVDAGKGEGSATKTINYKQKQANIITNSNISIKKPTSTSNIPLQSIIKDPKKQSNNNINITQRLARTSSHQKKNPQPLPQQSTQQPLISRNLSIRKQVNSNIHHKSVIINSANYLNPDSIPHHTGNHNHNHNSNSNHKISQMKKPITYTTPKSRQLFESHTKRDRISIQSQQKQKQKIQNKQDVRDMIKGYLIKKRKQNFREHQFRRQDLGELFKDI